ncbi:MAG: hypothetical protein RI949_2042 [Pseudomonadota bacterium]|jgi:hypothetical protein|nr:hypothetical protein [Betaproteobacteria bacterium]
MNRRPLDGATLTLWVLVATSTLTLGYVVPQVLADPFEGATPQKAVPALQAMALFDVSMAVGLVLFKHRWSQPGALRFSALGLLSVALLIQGLAYADASMAYLGHGPEMELVVWVLGAMALALILAATRLARSIWEVPGGPGR